MPSACVVSALEVTFEGTGIVSVAAAFVSDFTFAAATGRLVGVFFSDFTNVDVGLQLSEDKELRRRRASKKI